VSDHVDEVSWLLRALAAGGFTDAATGAHHVSDDVVPRRLSPVVPATSCLGRLIGLGRMEVVLIPTAGMYTGAPSHDRFLEPWRNRGLASLDLFHTFSREQANDPAFVKMLAEATGVWFGGGRQSLLVDSYRGTEVEKQLRALLARGGVIGGTSAGAAVMSRVMITSGREEARLAEGFDFVSEAVIDQHFLKRNRLKRLVGVVKRNPELVGLGVDERTAMVVDVRQKRFRVLGESYVIACLPEPPTKPDVPAGTRLEILKPGDEADLTALRQLKTDAVIPGLNLDAF
jgi:cyanophycinase